MLCSVCVCKSNIYAATIFARRVFCLQSTAWGIAAVAFKQGSHEDLRKGERQQGEKKTSWKQEREWAD